MNWLHDHEYIATWVGVVIALIAILPRPRLKPKPIPGSAGEKTASPPQKKARRSRKLMYIAAGIEVIIAATPIAEDHTRILSGIFAAAILFFGTLDWRPT